MAASSHYVLFMPVDYLRLVTTLIDNLKLTLITIRMQDDYTYWRQWKVYLKLSDSLGATGVSM